MTTNQTIESILDGLTVDNVEIPVVQGFYYGNAETYITYTMVGREVPLCADDDFVEVAELIDFDIYSKGDLVKVERAIKPLLKSGGFQWQPSRSSGDLYEPDTGYHHRTLCFAYFTTEQEDR